MMKRLAEKWHAFLEWQRKPYEVAPLSEENHTCATCGTEYQGNYCPRCGQSSRIGRYSFKKAFLLFLDVWGLGNRGMFRTLRDLVLRPGYMIRDYLSGMQMAYFPPFKLFFLLTALSVVIEGGMNISGKNYSEDALEELRKYDVGDDETDKKFEAAFKENGEKIVSFSQRFPSITTLFALFILSGFLYLFFRRSPAIPDLRFSEFLVSLVYIANMTSIYSIIGEFLNAHETFIAVTSFLSIIPLKQMSGFSWLRTILISLLAYFIAIILLIIGVVILLFVLGI